MIWNRLIVITTGVGLGVLLFGGSPPGAVEPAQTSTQARGESEPGPPKGNLQRSAEIFSYKQAAESGPQRTEGIYYFKCWICHNEYARTGPRLRDLYQRPRMLTGEPVNDETVAAKIRGGSPVMPAFRYSLTDQDIADLVSYMREGKCCFDTDNQPRNPRYRAHLTQGTTGGGAGSAPQSRNLRGGPNGVVRLPIREPLEKGFVLQEPLEGISVQLISHKTAIRTSVYSNEEGRYEFPQLEPGMYTLRIARPMEFRPYQKDSVRIDGATELEDIVLELVVTDSEFLPPTPEIAAQLTGVEWQMNLPGTGREKRVFSQACGYSCHPHQEIFRNRFDERSWLLIVQRMLTGDGAMRINWRSEDVGTESAKSGPHMSGAAEHELIAKWLGRVRGPDSTDPPFQILPRPRGSATRVIITEYELPRLHVYPHDAHGDSQGNIWYSSHKSPYFGKLDPRTGMVTEYRPPPSVPGAHPGTHRILVDKNDVVWASENWAHNLTRFDPKTEQFRQFHLEVPGRAINDPGFSNFAMDPQGYIWHTLNKGVAKIDPQTGKIIRHFPFPRKKISGTYDSMISWDGRFWAGGSHTSNVVALLDIQTGELVELETSSLNSRPSRGGFDPAGNAWFGGRGGQLIKLDTKKRRTVEYYPPLPYLIFYEAMPDKNGEIWAADMHSGRFLRFNPRTERWIQYVLPEPFSFNRRTWIDNSTDPVTVWYVDNNGYMVRVQSLE